MFLSSEARSYYELNVEFENATFSFELRITCGRKVVYSYTFPELAGALVAIHDFLEFHRYISKDDLLDYSFRIIPKLC